MIYTKEKIYNLALKHLGVTTSVENEGSNGRNRIVLDEFYDTAFGQVVESIDWTFLNTYRKLIKMPNEEPLNPNYQNSYDYPNDCATPRKIVVKKGDDEEFYEVANVNGNKRIWCNKEDAVLRYTARCDSQENKINEGFALALSWYLAFLACNSISGARITKTDCWNIYEKIIDKVQTVDANADNPIDNEKCTWFDVR